MTARLLPTNQVSANRALALDPVPGFGSTAVVSKAPNHSVTKFELYSHHINIAIQRLKGGGENE